MQKNTVFETERLYARKLTDADFESVCTQLQDPEVMKAYGGALSDLMVRSWLHQQQERYDNDGCGLYALLLKDGDVFVGQCGVILQEYEGRLLHEVEFLLSRQYWHAGLATEAAAAARDFAFEALHAQQVCCMIRDVNQASQKVAEHIGFIKTAEFVRHYRGYNLPHYLFSMNRAAWQALKNPQA